MSSSVSYFLDVSESCLCVCLAFAQAHIFCLVIICLMLGISFQLVTIALLLSSMFPLNCARAHDFLTSAHSISLLAYVRHRSRMLLLTMQVLTEGTLAVIH